MHGMPIITVYLFSHACVLLASYPGLLKFFNTHEKNQEDLVGLVIVMKMHLPPFLPYGRYATITCVHHPGLPNFSRKCIEKGLGTRLLHHNVIYTRMPPSTCIMYMYS